MRDVLRQPEFGPADDFFERGGDSLRAVQVVSRLVEEYATSDSPEADGIQTTLLIAIFDAATPADLAPIVARTLREVGL